MAVVEGSETCRDLDSVSFSYTSRNQYSCSVHPSLSTLYSPLKPGNIET